MTFTFKLIFFPAGAILGGILAIALKHWGVLPTDFDGRWIAVALAFGGLALGHWIDNRRECARNSTKIVFVLTASVSHNNAVEQLVDASGGGRVS